MHWPVPLGGRFNPTCLKCIYFIVWVAAAWLDYHDVSLLQVDGCGGGTEERPRRDAGSRRRQAEDHRCTGKAVVR